MPFPEKYIRFDWAAKRLLRDKANFDVLEGLITVLLSETVTITEILDSEGNQERYDDKYNRVDIKALNSKGEVIIVEIQLTRQRFFLRRMLYGTSKAVTEHIMLGEDYGNVRKVYSINIVYFNLGEGGDYLYHGRTVFEGVHTHDELRLGRHDNDIFKGNTAADVFPEYFIIRVNQFNDVAKTPIEEWLDYLKNNRIREDTVAPGLQAARKKMLYMQMSKAEQDAYTHHLDDIMQTKDEIETARIDGEAKGRAEALAATAKRLKAMGLATAAIQEATGLAAEEIEAL